MPLIERIMISAPCPISWDTMEGDNRVRHCSGCSKNVYNISDLTDREAEDFLQSIAGTNNHCMRFVRRSDGKVMTDNCPRGLRVIRDRVRKSWQCVAAALASLVALVPPSLSQQLPDLQYWAKRIVPAKAPEANYQYNPANGGNTVEFYPQYDSKLKVDSKYSYVESPLDALGGPMTEYTEPAPAPVRTVTARIKNGVKKVMIGGECEPARFAPRKGNFVVPAHGDKSAAELYAQASRNYMEQNYLLAQTQFQEALKIATAQKNSDPRFVQTIERGLFNTRFMLSPSPVVNEARNTYELSDYLDAFQKKK